KRHTILEITKKQSATQILTIKISTLPSIRNVCNSIKQTLKIQKTTRRETRKLQVYSRRQGRNRTDDLLYTRRGSEHLATVAPICQ
ncbi:unnamed protein product, partial [Lampetra planeri]